jgi:hypothetical protein
MEMRVPNTFVETAQPLPDEWAEVEHLIFKLMYLTRQQMYGQERFRVMRMRDVFESGERYGIAVYKLIGGAYDYQTEILGGYTNPVEAEGMLRLIVGVVRDNIVRSYE